MLRKEEINYRFQCEIKGIENGSPQREYIDLCWREYVIDTESGQIIPTTHIGIDSILLDDYPQAKADVERAVVSLIAAQKDWREKQALLNQQTLDEISENPLEAINESPEAPQ